MRNIQIIIEYDGTNYCGWQVQKNGISIQEKIGQSIVKITKASANIIGASRTDAGVHALGQSAHFKTASNIPIEKIPAALNSQLPKDIRVINAIERPLDFHSRYHSLGKEYEYIILNNEYGSALERNRVLHLKGELDVLSMADSAKDFVGTHDFMAFSSSNTQVRDKIRTIVKSEITTFNDKIIYNVEGNGFLYNMVRIIVGTLILVGRGKIKSRDISRILEERNRIEAGPTAPAQGLYLKRVLY